MSESRSRRVQLYDDDRFIEFVDLPEDGSDAHIGRWDDRRNLSQTNLYRFRDGWYILHGWEYDNPDRRRTAQLVHPRDAAKWLLRANLDVPRELERWAMEDAPAIGPVANLSIKPNSRTTRPSGTPLTGEDRATDEPRAAAVQLLDIELDRLIFAIEQSPAGGEFCHWTKPIVNAVARAADAAGFHAPIIYHDWPEIICEPEANAKGKTIAYIRYSRPRGNCSYLVVLGSWTKEGDDWRQGKRCKLSREQRQDVLSVLREWRRHISPSPTMAGQSASVAIQPAGAEPRITTKAFAAISGHSERQVRRWKKENIAMTATEADRRKKDRRKLPDRVPNCQEVEAGKAAIRKVKLPRAE